MQLKHCVAKYMRGHETKVVPNVFSVRLVTFLKQVITPVSLSGFPSIVYWIVRSSGYQVKILVFDETCHGWIERGSGSPVAICSLRNTDTEAPHPLPRETIGTIGSNCFSKEDFPSVKYKVAKKFSGPLYRDGFFGSAHACKANKLGVTDGRAGGRI